MLTAILSNGVRTVIVERLDRLAREYGVQEQLLVYLAAKGVALCTALYFFKSIVAFVIIVKTR